MGRYYTRIRSLPAEPIEPEAWFRWLVKWAAVQAHKYALAKRVIDHPFLREHSYPVAFSTYAAGVLVRPYWAKFVMEFGHGEIRPRYKRKDGKRKRLLVGFADGKDDPRFPGRYPIDYPTKELTKRQFALGMKRNLQGRFMWFTKRIPPRPPSRQFSRGMEGFQAVIDPILRVKVDNYVRRYLRYKRIPLRVQDSLTVSLPPLGALW